VENYQRESEQRERQRIRLGNRVERVTKLPDREVAGRADLNAGERCERRRRREQARTAKAIHVERNRATNIAPSKKFTEMSAGNNALGCASKPKTKAGAESVIVSVVKPPVHSTVGVVVSVLGGAPHVPQVAGTVRTTRSISKDTVSTPSESDGIVEKSGSVILSSVVSATYCASGSWIGVKSAQATPLVSSRRLHIPLAAALVNVRIESPPIAWLLLMGMSAS